MRVTVTVRRIRAKNVVAFKTNGVPLTGFGSTSQAALDALSAGVASWCRALNRQGRLDEAIRRAGWHVQDDGNDSVTPELIVEQPNQAQEGLAEAV